MHNDANMVMMADYALGFDVTSRTIARSVSGICRRFV